jgi:AcrR family transcriptional regulator
MRGRAWYRGTRVRASNAMGRTRLLVLDAVADLLVERGVRKTSMTEIALAAGIAKGTLYNHFRTKDEVLAALAEAEVQAVVEECRSLPLAEALAHAAWRAGTHPVVRRLAAEEPSALVALLVAGPSGVAWRTARRAVADLLVLSGKEPDAADLVVRWVASHCAAPSRTDALDTAALLATALPDAGAHHRL